MLLLLMQVTETVQRAGLGGVGGKRRGVCGTGARRGRGSLTRCSIQRDKEKRKCAAEKQSHMEALYRLGYAFCFVLFFVCMCVYSCVSSLKFVH